MGTCPKQSYYPNHNRLEIAAMVMVVQRSITIKHFLCIFLASNEVAVVNAADNVLIAKTALL